MSAELGKPVPDPDAFSATAAAAVASSGATFAPAAAAAASVTATVVACWTSVGAAVLPPGARGHVGSHFSDAHSRVGSGADAELSACVYVRGNGCAGATSGMLMCTFLHSTTIDVTRDNLQRASSLCLPLLCAPSFSRRKAAIEHCRVLVCVAGVVHTGAFCDSSADFPAVECSRTRCTVPAVTARRALVRLSPTFRLTTPSASPRGAPFLPAMAGILATVPLWLRVLGAAELQRCHGCAVRVAGATARGVQFRLQNSLRAALKGGRPSLVWMSI